MAYKCPKCGGKKGRRESTYCRQCYWDSIGTKKCMFCGVQFSAKAPNQLICGSILCRKELERRKWKRKSAKCRNGGKCVICSRQIRKGGTKCRSCAMVGLGKRRVYQDKSCEKCGETFTPTNSRQRWCKSCRLTCPNCGNKKDKNAKTCKKCARQYVNGETSRGKKDVVATTDKDKRGVFGGKLVCHDKDNKTATMTDARMAVYWSSDVRGVLGLAANGPTESCRITPAVSVIELDGVTAVMDMSDKAREAWEKEPWG